ncbi:BatD family protein [Odoribacter sp. OttesenSCG-928-J03]|nr:BatD family protein [Odoribacter sp. OttesenSCG-928-J03]
MKQITILLLLLFAILYSNAQDMRYGVMLDTTYMLIGDQQKMTFIVSGDEYSRVVFPDLKGEITEGVEIVSGPVRDSVQDKSGKWNITETYVITAFDTGVYEIPAYPINIEKAGYNSVYRTDPLAFMVNTVQLKENEYFDIVMPYSAALNFAEVLPYVLYVLAGLLIIGVAIWLIRKYRKKEPIFKSEKVIIPPYIKAMQSLEQLKTAELWQSGHVKEYYSRLTDTLRLYLDEELAIPAMEQTSLETLQALKGNKYVSATDQEQLAMMLETADFVKFAKMQPLADNNTRNMKVAYDFLENVNVKVEEERKLQQEQKKQKEDDEVVNTVK